MVKKGRKEMGKPVCYTLMSISMSALIVLSMGCMTNGYIRMESSEVT